MMGEPRMYKRFILEQGFTLIELLIALFISIVIGAATIGFMTYSQKSHFVQEEVADAQQNVRIAMDHMLRDIRMAGYPLGYFQTAGFSPIELVPITGVDNVGTLQLNNSGGTVDQMAGTDAIAVWRGDSGALPISCYPSGGGGAAAANIRIRNTNCPNTALRENDILLVIKADGSAFRTVEITNLNPCQLCSGSGQQGCSNIGLCDTAVLNPGLSNINSPGGLQEDYTGGNAVKFRRLVYFLNPAGRLMRSENNDPPVPLATNVEDLQFAYIDNNLQRFDTPGEITPNIWRLRRIRLNLLTRTADPDPLMTSSRPPLEDRLGGANETPGYRRRLLQSEIHVRNIY
jgi:prepilin-type N-terminal cleavage/methylation domain-containing protein